MNQNHQASWRLRMRFRMLMVVLGTVFVGPGFGCRDDARLADHRIPTVTVSTVQDQGLVLDEDADPIAVAYVLLQAIRDDALAGSDRQARRSAQERQFAVCDPDYLYAWYQRALGKGAVSSQDEWVYKKVSMWAPTLAAYAEQLDLDIEAARARMTVSPIDPGEGWPGETAQVRLGVPGPDGSAEAGVTVMVWLHRHELGYWRVFAVGFAPVRATVPADADPASD